ncbi:MAG: phosphoribosylamine--glycine ligase [Chloroflexi bacterium]|nr:MAG: phosphoribosylamine--glycine ligase [Chloroflexota bacterium]
MKILVVGGGGREHALVWKLAQSGQVEQIFTAPGNGGTDNPAQNWANVPADRPPAVFAQAEQVDLTVVGPEVPLAKGIVDDFQAAGLTIWGPSRAAARIEADKAFAKSFMERHGIPTARYAAFTDFEAARRYLRAQDGPVVIKASGLAAGKGVLIPESPEEAETALRRVMVEREFGAAGEVVVIEERLSGPEVSVLAFSDGEHLALMPPAQDHKRAYDNDAGPNTGGMGAYAPAPVCPPALQEEIRRTVLQPAVDGLRAEGAPYVGVLYAGLMLTPRGPRVLEFNCRFGDPETQVILPLLQTDLLEIIEHSLNGTLHRLQVQWRPAAAATVVMASGGYPGSYRKGYPIDGLEEAAALEGVIVFHAGTARTADGRIVTAGGRVLNVTGVGDTLTQALARAYAGVRRIHFTDAHYRTDIGAKAEVRP